MLKEITEVLTLQEREPYVQHDAEELLICVLDIICKSYQYLDEQRLTSEQNSAVHVHSSETKTILHEQSTKIDSKKLRKRKTRSSLENNNGLGPKHV